MLPGDKITQLAAVLAKKEIRCEFPTCEQIAHGVYRIAKYTPFLCEGDLDKVTRADNRLTHRRTLLEHLQDMDRAANRPPRWS